MNEEQIRQLIREEVNKRMSETDTVNQFALAQTSFHTHNGVDSKKIPFIGLSDTPVSFYGQAGKVPTVNATENALEFTTSGSTYAGRIDSSGTAVFLPDGWSCSKVSTGHYVITHTLGTTNYAVTAATNTSSAVSWAMNGTSAQHTTTTFQILTVYPDAAFSYAFIDKDFDFIVVTS